jgi:predicted nucleic acid-binding protein
MGAFVQSQQQAWSAYDALAADPRVLFLAEPTGLEDEFRRLTQSSQPSHSHWTDAYLAAIATVHHATVTTFDHGFARLPGVDVELLT